MNYISKGHVLHKQLLHYSIGSSPQDIIFSSAIYSLYLWARVYNIMLGHSHSDMQVQYNYDALITASISLCIDAQWEIDMPLSYKVRQKLACNCHSNL